MTFAKHCTALSSSPKFAMMGHHHGRLGQVVNFATSGMTPDQLEALITPEVLAIYDLLEIISKLERRQGECATGIRQDRRKECGEG